MGGSPCAMLFRTRRCAWRPSPRRPRSSSTLQPIRAASSIRFRFSARTLGEAVAQSLRIFREDAWCLSGKHHELAVHHKAEEYLDAYIRAASIAGEKGTRCGVVYEGTGPKGEFASWMRLRRWPHGPPGHIQMIKRRCRDAALGAAANCYTFRATGVTAYLLNGGSSRTRRQSPSMKVPELQSCTTAHPMKSRSMRSSGLVSRRTTWGSAFS